MPEGIYFNKGQGFWIFKRGIGKKHATETALIQSEWLSSVHMLKETHLFSLHVGCSWVEWCQFELLFFVCHPGPRSVTKKDLFWWLSNTFLFSNQHWPLKLPLGLSQPGVGLKDPLDRNPWKRRFQKLTKTKIILVMKVLKVLPQRVLEHSSSLDALKECSDGGWCQNLPMQRPGRENRRTVQSPFPPQSKNFVFRLLRLSIACIRSGCRRSPRDIFFLLQCAAAAKWTYKHCCASPAAAAPEDMFAWTFCVNAVPWYPRRSAPFAAHFA